MTIRVLLADDQALIRAGYKMILDSEPDLEAVNGLSNEDIADRLHLSPLTAKTHVNRAMTKLAARDRAQLVVIAYQNGLVRPGDTPP
jgi:DNA-binding NarL/FixJ family response regulator